jgi:8-oxo-dGTP pyrophosphatase MutT (NUDIX family)
MPAITLAQYLPSAPSELRQATLVLLVRDGEILLAMKKRGFGAGRWNGVGGKVEAGESVAEAAHRETKEEIGIEPIGLREVAVLNFYSPHAPQEKDFSQQVVVYLAESWRGEPAESEEMAPQWFAHADIPYAQMWADDPLWLPQVIAGGQVRASFLFGPDQEVEDYNVEVQCSAH